MRSLLIATTLTLLGLASSCSGQVADDSSGFCGSYFISKGPQFIVLLEVLPDQFVDCAYPITTAMFEFPVTSEYYESVKVGQEVTSWFRSSGETSTLGGLVYRGHGKRTWRLVVRGKRTVRSMNMLEDSRETTEGFPAIGQ